MPSNNPYLIYNEETHRILMENPEKETFIIETSEGKEKVEKSEVIDLRDFKNIEKEILKHLAQSDMRLAQKQAEHIKREGGDYRDVVDRLEHLELEIEDSKRIAKAVKREYFNNREVYKLRDVFEVNPESETPTPTL